jgi:hypothetical protein
MLGGIKIKGEAGASLFRTLSRRWAPVVPLKPQRSSLSHALNLENGEASAPSRAWIGVERPASVPVVASKVKAKRSDQTWSPWLWVK